MKCVACLQGQEWECRGNCSSATSSSVAEPAIEVEIEGEEPQQLITYKDESTLRDQQSTGRKRAARAFPLEAEKACEWNLQQNCGGGKYPIVGCREGMQQARHHGPDKNTLNNEVGNVHRICHECHNRWHTLNDKDYNWSGPHDAHNPCACSIAVIEVNEAFWKGRKIVRAKD